MKRRTRAAAFLLCFAYLGCGGDAGAPRKSSDPEKAKAEMKQLQDTRQREAETGKK